VKASLRMIRSSGWTYLLVLCLSASACGGSAIKEQPGIRKVLDSNGVMDVVSLDSEKFGDGQVISVVFAPSEISKELCSAKQISIEVSKEAGVWVEVSSSTGVVLALSSCQSLSRESKFILVDSSASEIPDPAWGNVDSALKFVMDTIGGRADAGFSVFSPPELESQISSLSNVDLYEIRLLRSGRIEVSLLNSVFLPRILTIRISTKDGAVESAEVDLEDSINVVQDSSL